MHDPFALIKRPARRLGLLSGAAVVALFGASQPADALTIIPVFDASWAAAPAGATTDVNNVIAEYEADFSNPVTVTVAFGWGELNGSPISSGAATVFAANDFPPPFGPASTFSLSQVKGFYNTAAGGAGATGHCQQLFALLLSQSGRPFERLFHSGCRVQGADRRGFERRHDRRVYRLRDQLLRRRHLPL